MENSMADLLTLSKSGDNNELFGGGIWGFILVFFIIAMFGGGSLGFGANAATNQINNDFLYTNLNSTMDRGFNQISNQAFGINKDLLSGFNGLQVDLCNGFNGVNGNITQLGYMMQNCCCETNRNIDAVRYENSKNTCDITTAIHNEGEATRALITANVMQELRDNLQSTQLALSNLNQTQNIINSIRPCPVPAYITCSPYAVKSDSTSGGSSPTTASVVGY